MRHFYCKEMCNAGPETIQAVRGFSPTTQPMRPTAVRPSSGAHTCERSRLCVVSTAPCPHPRGSHVLLLRRPTTCADSMPRPLAALRGVQNSLS